MKRVVHKSMSFEEAEQWDVEQAVSMTPEQRQKIAWMLKKRAYGDKCPDVREVYKK